MTDGIRMMVRMRVGIAEPVWTFALWMIIMVVKVESA